MQQNSTTVTSLTESLEKINEADNNMLALQVGLREVVNLACVERGVLLIRPSDGDEAYPLVVYGSGEVKAYSRLVEPDTLFDNWALSWSAVDTDWYSIPLKTFERVVGAIYLNRINCLNELSPHKRTAIELISQQLAFILACIRKDNQLLQTAREKQTLLQMLSTVGQIDQRLNANLDTPQILLELQETCYFLLNAEHCFIWSVEWESESLSLLRLNGEGYNVQSPDADFHNSIAGWVVRTGESLLVSSADRFKQYDGAAESNLDIEIQQLLCMPLRINGRILWVLQVFNKLDGVFDEVDLSLMKVLVTNAATAIENAFRQTSQRVREEQNAEVYSIASHGLRSPLMSILTSIEWMLDTSALSNAHKKRLEDIRLQTLNLTRFATKILDLSRIETHSIVPNLMPVALIPLIRRLLAGFDFRASEHQFELKIRDAIPPVRADEMQLSIILDHLLDNAIKYSPANSLITVEVLASDDNVIICVCDQGNGVPPEEMSSLFTRFYRGRKHTAGTRHSLGLGLYIVKTLVEIQGGHISVENRTGAGACFSFTLPQEEIIGR